MRVCEYYNPVAVTIPYRGHTDRLFKPDFAGEILDRFDDVELVDYGFACHRDPVHPQDDISWFSCASGGSSALEGDIVGPTGQGGVPGRLGR